MKSDQQITPGQDQRYMLSLYDRYGGMLLGYISEIVNNHALAEQYLVHVFKEIARQQHQFSNTGNTWCQLQQLTKIILSDLLKNNNGTNQTTAGLSKPDNQNQLVQLMSDEQRLIFCEVYYHGKTTTELACQLNTTEQSIRKVLKDAFIIIRQRREQ